MLKRFISPRYWPTWLGLALLRLSALLPFGVLVALGKGLGAILRRLPVRFLRDAQRNIELCLPELDASQRRKLLGRHFASLGLALFETALSWWAPNKRILRLARVEGLEHVRQAHTQGRGVILLSAHFTTLEIGARILSATLPLNVVYRPTKNELLAYFLSRNRGRLLKRAIARDDIRSMIGALKNAENVWYAPDQAYRKKGAEMVPLFGIPAATNTATSRLARMTGAAVLPYFVERLPGTRGYRAIIHPPLADFPSESPAADAARFNRLIEAQVRRVPEQYLWIHRRFKGLDAEYPDYYERRVQT